MKRAIGLCAAVLMLGAIPSRAFWFFGGGEDEEPRKEEVRRRYHMRLPDKMAETEMLDLFRRKTLVMEQVGVLKDLEAEKKRELAEFRAKLLREFGMESDVRYEYDPRTQTIHRIMDGDKRLHLKLVDKRQILQFGSLYAGQQLVLDELRVFRMVLEEKGSEMERINARLEERFSIRMDRNYQYDPESMRLYELEPEDREQDVELETLLQAPVPLR